MLQGRSLSRLSPLFSGTSAATPGVLRLSGGSRSSSGGSGIGDAPVIETNLSRNFGPHQGGVSVPPDPVPQVGVGVFTMCFFFFSLCVLVFSLCVTGHSDQKQHLRGGVGICVLLQVPVRWKIHPWRPLWVTDPWVWRLIRSQNTAQGLTILFRQDFTTLESYQQTVLLHR